MPRRSASYPEQANLSQASSAEIHYEAVLMVGIYRQAINPTSADPITAALLRGAEKKAAMDKLERSLDFFTTNLLPARECHRTHRDSKVQIADARMVRLLLVLHEIDEAVAGLEELPQTDLIDLVSSAILACGFVDGTEARHAIVAVLESIEGRGPTPDCS